MRVIHGAAVIALAATLSLSCGGGNQPVGGGLRVVATTTIVGDLVRVIGGPEIELETLMGPGVDPHLYKPSAGDVRRMSSAQVVFFNGLHLEGKMSEVMSEMGARDVTTVAVAECVPEDELISSPGFSGVHDPHIWFDVALWMRVADCVSDALVALDPENAASFRKRAEAYRAELEVLDDWVKDRVAKLPEEQRVLVTAHDAFSYFGRAYGFEVRGLMGISTASEAGTADVQQLADFIAERRIPALFVESSVSPRFVEALQQAVVAKGFDVAIGGSLFSDALGDPGEPAATYVGTVRSNVEAIVTALAAAGNNS